MKAPPAWVGLSSLLAEFRDLLAEADAARESVDALTEYVR